MEDQLDQYLRQSKEELKPKKRGSGKQKKEKVKSWAPSHFKMWAASSAIDLFKFYVPLLVFAVSGFILFVVDSSLVKYCLYGIAVVILAGVFFYVIDQNHFFKWTKRLSYKFDGWSHVLNSRSRTYWDMNGEHWVPVKIVIALKEPVNEKHHRVLEMFLRKLRIRLNKWTVSENLPIGSSQPKGWTHDGLILAGEMNPRVLNLIRKKFSKELNRLSALMPGSIDHVTIVQTGKEEYHHVVADTSD